MGLDIYMTNLKDELVFYQNKFYDLHYYIIKNFFEGGIKKYQGEKIKLSKKDLLKIKEFLTISQELFYDRNWSLLDKYMPYRDEFIEDHIASALKAITNFINSYEKVYYEATW